MATGCGVCIHIVKGHLQFLVWALGDRPGKAVWRLCGDYTELVHCQCNCHAVSMNSTRKAYDTRVGSP